MKNTCRPAGNVRIIHRNIAAFLDLPHRNIRSKKITFKGKAAADQEADKIISPVRRCILHLSGQNSLFINAVARNVRCNVRIVRNFMKLSASGITHLQKRAGSWISLCKQQKIISDFARQRHQVCLCIALTHSGSLSAHFSASDFCSHL